VRYDQDFLLYIGHERQFSLTENPSELRVDIDLHGMTKKPALDILQSSLLYYHELLVPGKLEQMLATRAMMLSTSNKAGVALSLNPSRVKAFVVVYVVGQGLHSPGAVPVLRNAFTRELEQYWSVFDSFTDPANAGQIVVRVRRVR
jgi:DNA-nicking Smr family endonuclease